MKGITFLGNVSLECTIDGLYEKRPWWKFWLWSKPRELCRVNVNLADIINHSPYIRYKIIK